MTDYIVVTADCAIFGMLASAQAHPMAQCSDIQFECSRTLFEPRPGKSVPKCKQGDSLLFVVVVGYTCTYGNNALLISKL